MASGSLHIETPYRRSHSLSKVSGLEIYLKLENVQPPGSFKIRGIGHLCQKSAAEGCKRFVCSSGGNAGMAAAYAARCLNIPISLFVPKSTPQFTVERLEEEGAEVTVVGSAWDDTNEHALEFAKELGNVYISPFNHPDIWEGHASLIDEIDEKPDLVICSVGGGGLLCGMVQGLKRRGWNDVPVLAVETIGAHSFFEAVHAGKLVTLPAITSIAKSLGAKTVASAALQATKDHPIVPCTVSDRDTVIALAKFLGRVLLNCSFLKYVIFIF
ncbi:unnamed protein product [Clavelina lepadiformis]|uniref:L-serine ammonia-lyase n=1 Tax=Clavelina lepadiformis TaxID=159417 RepID=A0ABP0FKX5_CLALP